MLIEKGERRVSPFLVPMMMPNAAGAAISMRYGLQGPNETITTACAAATHAIGYAARLIAWGMLRRHASPAAARAPAARIGVAGVRQHDRAQHRRAPAGRSTPSATASCSARARRCSCSRSGSPPSTVGPPSSARCSARPATPTPTTSPRPRPAAPAPSPAWSWRCDDAGLQPADIAPDQRPRHVDAAERRGRGRGRRRRCSARARCRSPPPRASPATRSAPPARWRRPPCCCRWSTGSSRRRPAPRSSTTDFEIDLVMGERPPVGARPDDVEQLRLRRPQRLGHPRPRPTRLGAGVRRRRGRTSARTRRRPGR